MRPFDGVPRIDGTMRVAPIWFPNEIFQTRAREMQRSKPETRSATDRLTLFVRAMALGVFCAGLLLSDPQIDLDSVISVRHFWLARLLFLLWVGISFGIGATLAKIL